MGLSAVNDTKGEEYMRIAIPVANKQLCLHFGHCEEFVLIDVDEAGKSIVKKTFVTPPPHEPGMLPAWIASQGATVIIAGGMGSRAQGLFAEKKIEVVVGAVESDIDALVAQYLNKTLVTGSNACDH